MKPNAIVLNFLLAISVAHADDGIVRKMTPGINLGNTLEAIPTETSWGNPVPTEAYFRAVRAAGFKSVRLPIAWTQYADKQNVISPKWMAHVTDVIRMANKAGLIAMINVHWDGGWMQPIEKDKDAVNAKLAKFWTQIATNFKGFDDRLLFAGTNEVGVANFYGPPTTENAEVQNSFNQIFVNAVRATGGMNKTRWLVVQAYNTNIDLAGKVNTTLPKDSAKDRLLMEVHYYDPYDFTLNDKSDVWQWGAKATDPKATETWASEAYCDTQFEKMKQTFGDKGVPVILGEYCTGMKPRFPGMRPFLCEWDRYVTQSAVRHGLVPMFWDTGQLFERVTGAQKDPELINIIVGASK